MTAFTSRWADWKPSNSTEGRKDGGNGGVRGIAPPTPETPIQRTDRTDKSPSVSFVSASPERFQPETVFGAEHDSIREQARSNGSNSPPGWGDATAAVEWFLGTEPPRAPFVMVWSDHATRPAVTISDPARYWRDLRTDLAAGARLGRDHVGAVRADLKRLYQLFGPHGK